ncbi:MAG: hypothetical protein O2854_02950, partial [Chloroflexi bacterium]|nr:hypothetical protein [Chloroflexota bacterium]
MLLVLIALAADCDPSLKPITVDGPPEVEGRWTMHLEGVPCGGWDAAGIEQGALGVLFDVPKLCGDVATNIGHGDRVSFFVDGELWTTSQGDGPILEDFFTAADSPGTVILIGPAGAAPDATATSMTTTTTIPDSTATSTSTGTPDIEPTPTVSSSSPTPTAILDFDPSPTPTPTATS